MSKVFISGIYTTGRSQFYKNVFFSMVLHPNDPCTGNQLHRLSEMAHSLSPSIPQCCDVRGVSGSSCCHDWHQSLGQLYV